MAQEGQQERETVNTLCYCIPITSSVMVGLGKLLVSN